MRARAYGTLVNLKEHTTARSTTANECKEVASPAFLASIILTHGHGAMWCGLMLWSSSMKADVEAAYRLASPPDLAGSSA